MKFKDIKYVRPNLDEIKEKYIESITKFKEASSFEGQDEVFTSLNEMRSEFDTMMNLVYIRHSTNTFDEFYDKEKDYLNEISPTIEKLFSDFIKVFLKSEFINDFKEKYGENLIDVYRLKNKIISDDVIELIAKENKLSSEYGKLMGTGMVEFDSKEMPLAFLIKYFKSLDRDVRREANEVHAAYFDKHSEEFDRIFDELVHTRHEIAKRLGYENFIQLGYDRLGRASYTHKEVAEYREKIIKYVVPEAVKLLDKKREMLELDTLYNYDAVITFKDGDPKPVGGEEYLVKEAKKMYEDMSSETGELMNALIDGEYFDLSARKGKAPGGYCTFIEGAKMPFIYSNFNGTQGDVDVLTHEFGHSFQTYMSMNIEPMDIRFPGYEAAEIHSMSMEYLAYPYMKSFFGDDYKKSYYSHMAFNILFLPYGACVDEFQHRVYEEPNMTPAERKALWTDLEKKYTPALKYEDTSLMNKGIRWIWQSHIFHNPFYYIDYTLAEVVAMQVYKRDLEDHKYAWDSYIKMCKVGGKYAFEDIVKIGGFNSPFEGDTLKETISFIVDRLENIEV